MQQLNMDSPAFKDHPHIDLIKDVVTSMSIGIEGAAESGYAKLKQVRNDYSRRACIVPMTPIDKREAQALDEACDWIIWEARRQSRNS